jgi:hypothetical protein
MMGGLIALALLFWGACVSAQPAFDTACSAQGLGVTGVSVLGCTATGTNRLAVLGNVLVGGVASITSMTYGGEAAVAVDTQANGDFTANMRRVIAPATGAQTAAVNYDNTVDAVLGVATFTGVHQTTPLGTPAKATGNASPATVDVSSATGELVVDLASAFDSATWTIGAGQTQRWNQTLVSNYPTSMSTEAGAASVTMSWTKSGGDPWVTIGVSIKPAAAAAAVRRTGPMVLP